jgi:hypothetical protein
MRKLLCFIALLTFAVAILLEAQVPTAPLSQNQLIEALKAGGLSADDLAAIIRRRGIDFEMTVDLERKFRDAGADSGIVVVLWDKEQWNPPAGSALTKDFLIALLQSGTSPQRLSKWIVGRKVDLELTQSNARDLQIAGASDQVMTLITTNNIWVHHDDKPRYEDLLSAAQSALKAGNYEVAENKADAAELSDPSRPEAYALIGFVYLYHFNSLSKAASEYRSAIERGGEVEFRVRHVDHVSKIGKVDTCVGQILLKRGSFVFNSNRSDHNMAIKAHQIVEARLTGPSAVNPLAKSGVRMLVSQGGGKPYEVMFHAARNKDEKDEETILADLINVIRQ